MNWISFPFSIHNIEILYNPIAEYTLLGTYDLHKRDRGAFGKSFQNFYNLIERGNFKPYKTVCLLR